MNRILFDINIVLDVLLDRVPFAQASRGMWAAVESGAAEGLLAAHAITTIHHLMRKHISGPKAKSLMAVVLRVFRVAAVDDLVIHEALTLSFSDFEDAVSAAAARIAGCDFIVTRDPKGFRGSPVPAFSPETLLPLLRHA